MSAGSEYQRLRAHLAFLRMGAAAEALPGLLDEAAAAGLGNQAFLERLLAVEVDAVDVRRRGERSPRRPLRAPPKLDGVFDRPDTCRRNQDLRSRGAR